MEEPDREERSLSTQSPRKKSAQNALWYAVLSGKIVRRDECEVCGAKKGADTGRGTRVIIDAHHHDYSKPLEVEWLCRKCHNAEGRAYRALVEDVTNGRA